MVFPVYGTSEGSKEAIAMTEAILQSIRREIRTESHKPTIVTGDFNKEPSTLQTVKEWKKEESWVDVGEVPSWWGRRPNEPTCHSRQGANPTRIDGYVVNPSAMITIHDYEVDKRELIPTHSILRLELSKSSFKEERTYLRQVPSLKCVSRTR